MIFDRGFQVCYKEKSVATTLHGPTLRQCASLIRIKAEEMQGLPRLRLVCYNTWLGRWQSITSQKKLNLPESNLHFWDPGSGCFRHVIVYNEGKT